MPPIGMSSFMPGFTPVIMNVPLQNPELSMGQMQPMFLPMGQMPMQMHQMNGQSISPMLLPQTAPFIPQMTLVDPSLSPPVMFNPSLSPSLPPVMVSSPPTNSVPPSISQSISQSKPPQSQNNYLGAALRGDRMSRSRTRSPSIASESDSGEIQCRGRSLSRESGASEGPSKRALVDRTLGWMESVFGDKYDNDGTRGENVLRLKVKTVIALEHIIRFIELCHAEGLIESISCPVSTKKGRQHVRGYLAYIKGFSGASADRIETIFEAFNRENNFPFKTLHRNPASTL